MKTVSVMALALLLLSATLLTVLLLIPEKKKTYTDLDYLFPAVTREYIREVELHPNGKESYSVLQVASSASNTASFVLHIGDVSYSWLTLDPETLSTLVVGAGQAVTYQEVMSKPTDPSAFESQEEYERALANYEKRLVTYGLNEGKADKYILRTVTGEEYTVYYGKKNHAGSGYYVRLDGKDTVYVSASTYMGDLLAGTPEQFVLGTRLLPAADNSLAYAYPRRFEVSSFLVAEGTAVEAEDILTLTVRLADGSLGVRYIDLAKATSATRQALVGRAVGDRTADALTLSDVFMDQNGKRGESESVTLLSIDEAERLWFGMRYLFANEHDASDKYGAYTFYAPATITACRPNNSSLMAALEKLYELAGKVVHIGLDDAVLDKYGLLHQKILFEYPVFGEEPYERKKDENGNDVKDKNGNYVYTDIIDPDYYLTGMLYVSAAKDGVCYVASTLYDFVAEIEVTSLAFLYRGLFDLVSPYLFAGEILDISSIDFLWNYGATDGLDNESCHIDVETHFVTNSEGNTSEQLKNVTALFRASELTLDLTSYNDFCSLFYYLRYAGESGLSSTEKDAYRSDPDAAVLTISFTMDDGTVLTYRFVPYDSNKMAVLLTHGSTNTESNDFFVYATDVKALATQYLHLMGLSSQ